MMRNVHRMMVLLGSGLALAACATARPVPTERLGAAQAAIRSAAEVGAEKVPQASLYLRYAEEEEAQGKKLVAAGENDQASVSFRRASADAELALSLAREATARNEATTATTALQAGTNGVK
jgi:Domain of unknown function (DUF4398)